MAKRKTKVEANPLAAKLDDVLSVLQSLLILEGARAGMNKADVRSMVGIGDARVGMIWKKLNLDK